MVAQRRHLSASYSRVDSSRRSGSCVGHEQETAGTMDCAGIAS